MQKVVLGGLAFGLVVIYATRAPEPTRTEFTMFLLGLVVPVAVAMRLCTRGAYWWAAALTVLVSMAPAWFSLIVDPHVIAGDYVPMAFAVLPMMLAAMLLGLTVVLAVAGLQGIGFAVLIASAPPTGFNWPSLLSLMFLVTVLSCVYCVISRADIEEIETNNRALHDLQGTLHHASIHDELTGLYNRRYVEDQLEQEITRARRNHTRLAICMLDIDHFKQVNDENGHGAGDEVLRHMGRALVRRSRSSDSACRLGGDEFLIILSDADLESARLAGERLRADLHEWSAYQPEPTVTLSVGVAAYPGNGTTVEELLRAADTALYAAKADGRDRVAVARTPIDE
jgi:diguanylate cyclase (GGDEF)-like protein